MEEDSNVVKIIWEGLTFEKKITFTSLLCILFTQSQVKWSMNVVKLMWVAAKAKPVLHLLDNKKVLVTFSRALLGVLESIDCSVCNLIAASCRQLTTNTWIHSCIHWYNRNTSSALKNNGYGLSALDKLPKICA